MPRFRSPFWLTPLREEMLSYDLPISMAQRVVGRGLLTHEGTLLAVGGCKRRAPLWNCVTNPWDPTVWLSTLTCCDEIAATYTFKVEGADSVLAQWAFLLHQGEPEGEVAQGF